MDVTTDSAAWVASVGSGATVADSFGAHVDAGAIGMTGDPWESDWRPSDPTAGLPWGIEVHGEVAAPWEWASLRGWGRASLLDGVTPTLSAGGAVRVGTARVRTHGVAYAGAVEVGAADRAEWGGGPLVEVGGMATGALSWRRLVAAGSLAVHRYPEEVWPEPWWLIGVDPSLSVGALANDHLYAGVTVGGTNVNQDGWPTYSQHAGWTVAPTLIVGRPGEVQLDVRVRATVLRGDSPTASGNYRKVGGLALGAGFGLTWRQAPLREGR